MKIEWRGDKVKNYYTNRNGMYPRAICNHISAGTMGSMYNWFTDPANKKASAHFGVGRNGEIHQYIDIQHGAWTQGIDESDIQYATANIVRDLGSDPNYWCVSIEHEGYIVKDTGERVGIDGDLTDAQFYATCWLHKHIQTEVEARWGIHITLGPYNVIGHCMVAPKWKPDCPGKKFNWQRLYEEMAIAEKMTLQEYELRLDYKQNPLHNLEYCTKVVSRVSDLFNKAQGGQWAHLASDKLVAIGKFMEEQDLMDP
jgi:N-acetylmuramoyl-L-alanine amidase